MCPVLNPSQQFDFGGNSKNDIIFTCENNIIFTANCENNCKNCENNCKNCENNGKKGEVIRQKLKITRFT